MSSTGGSTQGGRGLQFSIESERQSIVDIEEDTNNDHENTYLNINDRENSCLDIEEDSSCYIQLMGIGLRDFESTRRSIDIESNVRSRSTGNSTTYSDIEEDNNSINLDTEEDNSVNDQENQSQIREGSWNAKVEWMFVIGNLALEVASTIFDQLSSANNSRYALIGMLITYAAIVICIIELIYKWKKVKFGRRWKKILPLFYCPLPSEWPFVIGLICALGQSIVTTINYFDANMHIKICVWPIIFTFGLCVLNFRRISPPTKGLGFKDMIGSD